MCWLLYCEFAPLVVTQSRAGSGSDFFDGLHRVVLGGSYLTLPRIAGRNIVRNFYQANYRYVFAGARVCYDV